MLILSQANILDALAQADRTLANASDAEMAASDAVDAASSKQPLYSDDPLVIAWHLASHARADVQDHIQHLHDLADAYRYGTDGEGIIPPRPQRGGWGERA